MRTRYPAAESSRLEAFEHAGIVVDDGELKLG
jgi:hypothetical protein